MGLNRQRLSYGKHFQQKRQGRAEPIHRRAQHLGGALRHQTVQRDAPPANRYHRRRLRMRPDPQLRLRLRSCLPPLQPSQRRFRPPGVVLDRVIQLHQAAERLRHGMRKFRAR